MARRTESRRPLTVGELVKRHQDATGDSYADIARKTGLSKALVGVLANDMTKGVPRASTLTALHEGLGIALETLQAAAFASAGMASGGGGSTSQRVAALVPVLEQLADRDLAVIEGMALMMAKNDGLADG